LKLTLAQHLDLGALKLKLEALKADIIDPDSNQQIIVPVDIEVTIVNDGKAEALHVVTTTDIPLNTLLSSIANAYLLEADDVRELLIYGSSHALALADGVIEGDIHFRED